MADEPIKKPNWLGRNWKWFIPVAALAAIISIGLVAAIFIYSIFGIIKSTDAYKMSVKYAQENEEVTKAFGGEIKPGWFVLGSVHTSGPGGYASLQIPISNGDKTGTIYVEAAKGDGIWTIKKLSVEVNDTKERLTLIDE
jgi:hypothetical protein